MSVFDPGRREAAEALKQFLTDKLGPHDAVSFPDNAPLIAEFNQPVHLNLLMLADLVLTSKEMP